MHRNLEEKRSVQKFSELHYRSLIPFLPSREKIKMPHEVWQIITDYALEIRCSISNQPLQDPVIIVHPDLAPRVYNRQSAIDAADDNELRPYGITGNNVANYLSGVELPPDSGSTRFLVLNNSTNQAIRLGCEIRRSIEQNDPTRLQRAFSPIVNCLRSEWLILVFAVAAQYGSLASAFSPSLSTLFDPAILPAIGVSMAGYLATNVFIDYSSFIYILRRGSLVSQPQSPAAVILRICLPGITYGINAYYQYLFSPFIHAPMIRAISAALGGLFSIPRSIACTDLAIITHSQRLPSSTTEMAVRFFLGMCVFIRTGFEIYYLPHDPNSYILLVCISLLSATPNYYLSLREVASSVTNPRASVQHRRWFPHLSFYTPAERTDDEGESTLTFAIRTAARLAAAIFIGLICRFYGAAGATFEAIDMFIMSALITVLWNANAPYRLAPRNNAQHLSDDNEEKNNDATTPLLDP
ncbi:hypothetical protein [Coxiella burnetii]|uniref:hypothetical protein n=1 Tax=Coxiella burnetii TaxID=777 RepID=UPI0021AE6AF6|nr:hypothetical protein [Coxiella burnetii]